APELRGHVLDALEEAADHAHDLAQDAALVVLRLPGLLARPHRLLLLDGPDRLLLLGPHGLLLLRPNRLLLLWPDRLLLLGPDRLLLVAAEEALDAVQQPAKQVLDVLPHLLEGVAHAGGPRDRLVGAPGILVDRHARRGLDAGRLQEARQRHGIRRG